MYDVIIIGGSYSGLSAAMALGRSLRKVLIIDSGKPCNEQTPFSHNFLTQDGETPTNISQNAKKQVLKYPTIHFLNDKVIEIENKTENLEDIFGVSTNNKEKFLAKKILFATGLKDIMPEIKGYAECWGISILHCPYCHGYEFQNEKTALIGNGDIAFEFVKMIDNLTKKLMIFTNGKVTFTEDQTEKLAQHNITIVETEIESITHQNGQIEYLTLKNNVKHYLKAIYARPQFVQHCDLPQKLGCNITPQGLIEVDMFQKTNIKGIYASGDSTTPMRAISASIASGGIAGAIINGELVRENF